LQSPPAGKQTSGMTISAVIITRNEGPRIEACIRSVLPFCREVIVFDSLSEDDTAEKASLLGAVVIQAPFPGYGQAKNRAMEAASGEYILSIDADERPDPELAAAIEGLLTLPDPAGAYEFTRLNHYLGKPIRYGGWNPDYKIRLWKKGQAEWNHAEVHEELHLRPGTRVTRLPGFLLHYSYESVEAHRAKIEVYSDKGARELLRHSTPAYALKRFVSPAARWFRDYIFRLGFLDGYAGLIIANLTAREVWLKYSKLQQLQKENRLQHQP
jgi:glycosyltransferase involved in cell wall biosynthesis